MAATSLDTLPGEIFLHIVSYLEPAEAVKLQLVSKQLRFVGRDNRFWRSRSFDDSAYLETFHRRRRLQSFWDGSRPPNGAKDGLNQPMPPPERTRIQANWDPVFPGEKVSWYDEYIQRNAPIVFNWFQQPLHQQPGSSSAGHHVEARGLALYRPDDPDNSKDGITAVLAVAPLDDGSVCLWDVNGLTRRRGAIVSRSVPGLLFDCLQDALSGDEDSNELPKQFDDGVTECLSVDSWRHLAFFAVQTHLVQVDLKRLAVVRVDTFRMLITALSTSHPTVPLTVGMKSGIHLHDTRTRNHLATGTHSRVDVKLRNQQASHISAGPLSILHLQQPGSAESLSDDVYTAGRIPSILHYDRRNLSTIKDSIHSGASLCSLASLPTPFSSLDSDLRRQGLMSLGQVETSKSVPGSRTIIAGGEYKTKGSLEMYGIGPVPSTQAATAKADGSRDVEYQQNSVLKNRQTSSFSKLLSVANHGTRIAFSDGAGMIKWFERDGTTEVRRVKISGGEAQKNGDEEGGQEPSNGLFDADDAGDIARKLVPLRTVNRSEYSSVLNNDLLFWTGEKLGLVGFSSKPGFRPEDFVERAKTEQELALEREERAYSAKMRQLLEKQARDVRHVGHLGFGAGGRPI